MVLSCGCHQGHASYCFTNTVHTGWPHTIWNFCYPRVIFKLYPLPSSKARLLGLNRWMGRQQTIQRTMHIFRQDWIGLSELAMRRWVLSSHPALEISVLICVYERHLCFCDPLLPLHTLFTFNDFRIWWMIDTDFDFLFLTGFLTQFTFQKRSFLGNWEFVLI